MVDETVSDIVTMELPPFKNQKMVSYNRQLSTRPSPCIAASIFLCHALPPFFGLPPLLFLCLAFVFRSAPLFFTWHGSWLPCFFRVPAPPLPIRSVSHTTPLLRLTPCLFLFLASSIYASVLSLSFLVSFPRVPSHLFLFNFVFSSLPLCSPLSSVTPFTLIVLIRASLFSVSRVFQPSIFFSFMLIPHVLSPLFEFFSPFSFHACLLYLLRPRVLFSLSSPKLPLSFLSFRVFPLFMPPSVISFSF